MRELALEHGVRLPDSLRSGATPDLRATDERGWFRFQRLYDVARAVVRTEADVRRLLREAAEDEAAEGSGWLEIQVDPTSYAPRLGGLTPTMELILDAARDASERTGVGVGVVVAANRTRHPLDARTLARIAAQHAGAGVVGFGLSNDERRGRAEDFAPAFRIAARAGLIGVPHGGELAGPGSVAACLDALGAARIGHGVRSIEDPALVDRLAEAGTTLEVCPTSNLRLGVFDHPQQVPVAALRAAGVSVALGADDPLLFGSRLVEQYELARHDLGMSDAAIADLARGSVRGSMAPEPLRERLLTGIDAWLAADPAEPGDPADAADGGRDPARA
ncbi:MAG: adenosine deaminase [Actinomycetota bacterium]|nr:adenosine deaminase [Actinomycetota bacterium]